MQTDILRRYGSRLFTVLVVISLLSLGSGGAGGVGAAMSVESGHTASDTGQRPVTPPTMMAPTGNTSNASNATAANATGTMGSVSLVITSEVNNPKHLIPGLGETKFRVTVTKLNTTTFVVTHSHKKTTKRWFFPNNSTTHPNFEGHENDLWQTNQRAGWPGRLGNHTDKERLAHEIKNTKIYDEHIVPFIASGTHRNKSPKVDQPAVTDDVKRTMNEFDPVKNFRELVMALFGFGKGVVTTALDWIFGVPAPGDPTKPQTWLEPNNGIWGGIADFTKWTTGFATLLLAYSGGMTFLRTDATRRRQDWKRWGFALVMILGTWTLLPLGLHLANEVSQVVRPGAAEMFRSWASTSKVSVGLGFLVVLALLQQSILGIGIFVLAVERVIIFITVGFWPLAWALRSTRNDIARSLGQLCVFMLAMMIATKLGQAFMARLLFSLDWQVGSASLGETVIMLLTIGAGVAFMLIYFPFKMLQHANDAANVSLGMSAAAKASGQASEWVGQRASERITPHLKDKYESLREWRDDEPASSLADHKRQVGQVGKSRDDPKRTDYSAATSADGGFNAFDPDHPNRYPNYDLYDDDAGNDPTHSHRYQQYVDDLNFGDE